MFRICHFYKGDDLGWFPFQGDESDLTPIERAIQVVLLLKV